ncbi:hypothetical protein DQ04_00081260 [Trypanosoma grayi]|uniref:hypothetical protein n=1 Tax=Trypanosoma grayi TaxID=71804 RepID=UPI0004F43F0B|nr:hypothetical protein DQ04_00081260 [Trypanosoma grayi]KEG15427.1 hypothetical protein DQ04_00081260 [Trypanosoma grayi]
MGGQLPSARVGAFSAVYCDPYGAVWTVGGSGTRVFYFSASAVAEQMSPLSASTVEEPSAPLFECNDSDSVLAVVFPTTCGGLRVFACIATAAGCLVLVDADAPTSVLLCQCDLGVPLTAVAAAPLNTTDTTPNGAGNTEDALEGEQKEYVQKIGVLVSSFDGTFSEVVFVQWGDSNRSEAVDANGVATAGLYRIRGRLHTVALDETRERIVTVTQRGDVDVWNWRRRADETLSFGMPAYRAEEHGEPSCCVLLRGGRLWVGTATGCIAAFLLKPSTADGAPQRVWQAHRKGLAVRSLLVMSLGRHVWSYADDRRACVWDVDTLTLQGSFQFPGDGFAALRCGARDVRTTMWGVDASAGTATWLSVQEPLLHADSCAVLAHKECIIRRGDVERFTVLEALVTHLCTLLQQQQQQQETAEEQEDDREVREGADMSTPPHVELALQQLAEDYPTARALPSAVASLIVGQRMLRRALAEETLRSKSFLEDLQRLLVERRRHRELHAQVQRCLEELHGLLPREEQCESLDDVAVAVRSLLQRNTSPSTSLLLTPTRNKPRGPSHTRSLSADGVAAAASPPAEARDDHTHALQANLEEERRRRQHCEAQLVELDDERRELRQQLTQSVRQQEEYERRTVSLERSLKSAKKAAAVSSTEATRLCEMEASLHEARSTALALQQKVEALVRERHEAAQVNASLQASLRRFEAKEQLARRAFANFIETQEHVLDDLGGMLQHADNVGDDDDKNKALHTGVTDLHEWLCVRLGEQREFHAGLRRSYAQQCDGGGEQQSAA